MLPQVSVVDEPGRTSDGTALMPAKGGQSTSTFVVTVAEPPAPSQFSEYDVVSHNTPMSSEPSVSRGPDHPPEASHVAAPELVQLSVTVVPGLVNGMRLCVN